ncbi:hypothetical protein CRUP_009571 [Coryphaenoides rupestris]|nr:hypothetical protein CRUP_009571 [Coryphaenoides rupestris]
MPATSMPHAWSKAMKPTLALASHTTKEPSSSCSREQLLCMRPSVEQRCMEPMTRPPTSTTRTSRPCDSFTYCWKRGGSLGPRMRLHKSGPARSLSKGGRVVM